MAVFLIMFEVSGNYIGSEVNVMLIVQIQMEVFGSVLLFLCFVFSSTVVSPNCFVLLLVCCVLCFLRDTLSCFFPRFWSSHQAIFPSLDRRACWRAKVQQSHSGGINGINDIINHQRQAQHRKARKQATRLYPKLNLQKDFQLNLHQDLQTKADLNTNNLQ